MSLTWQCHLNQYIVTCLLTYLLTYLQLYLTKQSLNFLQLPVNARVSAIIDLDKKTRPTAAVLLACASNICHTPVHSFRFY